MRPGYGTRHPDVADLLSRSSPTTMTEYAWLGGTMPIRASAYCSVGELPELFVSSVRCIVIVESQIVVCETPDGWHPWPGGRRKDGETYTETACREVREETGWLIDPDSVEPIGWLHLEHLKPRPKDWPYPHPDFLQLVCLASVNRRCADPVEWVDTEGWEQRSRLVPLDEALQIVSDDCARVFLELIRPRVGTAS